MKFHNTITVVAIIVALIFYGAISYTQASFLYTMRGEIIEIQDDVITVMDEEGYTWEWEGGRFTINNEVIMTMSNRGTTNIFDDEIINIEVISR